MAHYSLRSNGIQSDLSCIFFPVSVSLLIACTGIVSCKNVKKMELKENSNLRNLKQGLFVIL